MSGILFIGDEVTAAGFRLAGVEVRTPEPAQLEALLAAESPKRSVILLTTGLVSQLPKATVDRLSASTDPLFVFLPDLRGTEGPIDLEAMVRRELGIEV